MEASSRGETFNYLNEDVKHILERKVQAILKDGGDINGVDHNGNSLLHITLKKCPDGEKVVQLLLEKNANILLQNGLGETPLMFAIRYNPGCVSLILNNKYGKYGVNIPNCWGYRALHYAVEESNIDVLNPDSNIVDLLLTHGAEVNCQDYYGRTPLHLANSLVCISKLLNAGARTDIKTESGWTPVHYAVYNKKNGKVHLLREKEENVYRPDNHEETPIDLVRTQTKLSFKILRTLLSESPLVDLINTGGQYRRAAQRIYLLDAAAKTLRTHSKKGFETLPIEVTWYILSFVDDDSLRNVMETIL